MFDISFSEMLLCFVIALVVLGPERMPGVARSVGRWVGKARGYMRNLTAELERESYIAEMKKQVEDAHRVLRDESQSMRTSLESGITKVREETRSIAAGSKPLIEPESVAESLPPPRDPHGS